MKRLLLFFTLLAMTIPLWAGLQTVTINRNDGQFEEANGVYYCYKSGLMMTFTSGLNNPNYLVEHQQVYFEVRSVNPEYIIKKIVFHCVDNTTSDNLDCFYWSEFSWHLHLQWLHGYVERRDQQDPVHHDGQACALWFGGHHLREGNRRHL